MKRKINVIVLLRMIVLAAQSRVNEHHGVDNIMDEAVIIRCVD